MRGALMTSPSSTKANWSRGDSPSMRFWLSRVLTWPKASAPSPFMVSCTIQAPERGSRPAVASVIARPSSSAGPRMNFAVSSGEQAITGSSFGALDGSLDGLAQSYAWNSAASLSVTHDRSLASVGSAVGSAFSEGSGLGYGVELPSSPTNSVLAAVV